MSESSPHQLLRENQQLKAELKVLSLQIKELQKQLYGSRSDKRPSTEDPGQGTLEGIDEGAWNEAQAPVAPRTRRPERKGKKKGPKPLNPHLPRVSEVVADPDLGALICPITGKLMRVGLVETIEVLSCVPAQYHVRSISRNLYVSAAGEAPVYSPWPKDVLPKSRIDTGVIAHLLTGRFADHQPYHRQQGQLARFGVDLAPNTMVSLVKQACEKLQPLYRCLIKRVLAGGYIQLDPTPIPMISEKKSGSVKQACMWTYRALDGPVFFEFNQTKIGATAARTLDKYKGILQTDGATNFGGLPNKPEITHLACWAHARRYFVAAAEAGEARAEVYLDRIDRLFYIERLARRWRVRAHTLLVLRQRHSQRLIDELFKMARDYIAEELLLKTPMPKAIRYLLGHEKSLRECFVHVPSRIDNNLAENALRPLKLGAKNWLFIGHPDAGPRAAIMFTLVENCRQAKINPEAYFADVLARIDDHPASRIEELIPQNWVAQNHPADI
jgi:transposase